MGKTELNRIKQVLVEKGKTSKELADHLKKTPRTVSAWCTNKQQPSLPTLFEIAQFLKVDPRELIAVPPEYKRPAVF